MHPLVDITRPFKKYLKTLILNPEEYKTPNEIGDVPVNVEIGGQALLTLSL